MRSTPLLGPAMQFLRELEQQNTKEFFTRERPRYDAARSTFEAMCEGVGEFGPWRLYRPHNDRRFRPDAAPYKTFLGAVAERPDGVGAFVQLSASGLLVGTGMPTPARDQLPRLRSAIADDRAGIEFVRAIDRARQRGAAVHGGRWPALQRMPRGYAADSPRAELLRWKGVEADVRHPSPDWPALESAVREVERALRAGRELGEWLAANVGPSALSAEERFAPRRRSGP